MAMGSSTVDRAIDVLTVISGTPGGLTNPEVCERLTIDRSAAHRLLTTMERRGLLQRVDRRRYVIGPGLVALAIGHTPDVRLAAEPVLADLVELTGESASLSVLAGDTFACIDHRPSPHELSYCPTTGARYPLHSAAAGLALWAFQPPATRERLLDTIELTAFTETTLTDRDELRAELDATIARGYGQSAGARAPGGCSIAMPVLGHQGSVLATLAISAAEVRLPLDALTGFANDLRRAADALGWSLGGREH